MAKRNNRAELKKLMDQYNLTRADVAKIVHVSPSTVDRWLQPKTKKGERNPTHRQMPDMAMELVQLKAKNFKLGLDQTSVVS